MGRSSLGFWLGSIVNFLYSLFSQPILRGLPRVARSPFFEVSAHGYNPGRGGGGQGLTPGISWWGVLPGSSNPDLISDQKM